MGTIVSWNGVSYTIPATGEENWSGTTGVDGLIISLAQNGFNKGGGLFTLSADVDFGGTAGLKAIYYKSRGTVSTAGILRLAKTESVGWRNNADSGNNLLTTDTSDNLTYNGTIIHSSTGIVPVAAGGTGLSSYTSGDLIYATGATTLSKLAIGSANKVLTTNGTAPSWNLIANANIDVAAAIAYSKLSLTGSIVNADISGSAAIAYSKLTLTGSIVNADVSASAAIAYSKLTLTGSIVNADVSGAAAIAYSKLSLTGSIVNADVSGTAAIAYSKLNLGTSIVNGDISASAAIARSKIASGTASHVVINDGSGNLSSEASLAISRGGTGQASQTAAFNALSPLTTKGDHIVHDGTNNVRLAVGANDTALFADSAQTTGTKWATISSIVGASQSDQETSTSTTKLVSPSVQQYHPSASKGWVKADFGGTAVASYNVTSITDGGAGNITVVWNVDFSSANYSVVATIQRDSSGTSATTFIAQIVNTGIAAGSTQVLAIRLSDFTAQDASNVMVAAFGDQ